MAISRNAFKALIPLTKDQIQQIRKWDFASNSLSSVKGHCGKDGIYQVCDKSSFVADGKKWSFYIAFMCKPHSTSGSLIPKLNEWGFQEEKHYLLDTDNSHMHPFKVVVIKEARS